MDVRIIHRYYKPVLFALLKFDCISIKCSTTLIYILWNCSAYLCHPAAFTIQSEYAPMIAYVLFILRILCVVLLISYMYLYVLWWTNLNQIFALKLVNSGTKSHLKNLNLKKKSIKKIVKHRQPTLHNWCLA